MSQQGPQARRKVTIIGGSMAGLIAALLFRKAGWDAHVYERSGTELAGRGAGIVTHAELFNVLKRCGIDGREAMVGVFVPGRRAFARDGSVIAALALEQVLTSWGHLYHLLRATLPAECYHFGYNLERVEELHDAAVAHFSNGETVGAELLIGADGIMSSVRAQFAPDCAPRYAGYIAWRGLVEEAALSPATREELCDYFAFSLPPGEQMLGYPVAGPNGAMARGERRFNFVWYRPAGAGAALDDLLTDMDGILHERSIPPNRIRREVIDAMRADAQRLLSPQFAEVVARTEQPFIQAIYDLESPRLSFGRIAIIGDAAFVARPHVGMGVTKAAGDAAALVDAIAAHPSDLPAAMLKFEAQRMHFGAVVLQHARHLGTYMQGDGLSAQEQLIAQRHRGVEAVMRETAVAEGVVV